ncbi:MAG: 4-alpha-glucanotransferase [Thermodesulfobacteriota bacterium]
MNLKRGSGILLHLTSLPSPFGIGDLGPWAYQFVDFLAKAKQRYWQILPLNPIDPIYGNSPYQSPSAFAGNQLLISPELLLEDSLLSKAEIAAEASFPAGKVAYKLVLDHKKKILKSAFAYFQRKKIAADYEIFCQENSSWLPDFALFMALKRKYRGIPWGDWPEELRDRKKEALSAIRKEKDIEEQTNFEKFQQYIFHKQWRRLKGHCQEKKIQIIGDLPIYVNYDSADVWAYPELFKLDEDKKPYVVAGVPPDYFSETGQLWGNPIYRWDKMQEDGYRWWLNRLNHLFKLVDIVRIDHFRGFVAYWEVPAQQKTAVHGRWIEAPAIDFFSRLKEEYPTLPFIAEDLGLITPDVKEVMHHYQLPGMKVLLFAFGPEMSTNPYLPHNFSPNCVAYTGTHDNNTIKGWFEEEALPEEKERLFKYLGRKVSTEELAWKLIRLLMMSVADTVIFPMQDILGLGAEARMNRPSTSEGNWEWRLLPDQINDYLAAQLAEMTEIYGRAPMGNSIEL